ncbi:TKL protein kinase [Saprolegnia parasitica CBS 223.65]|uniref:TKL protein kinase n=1 Tax=Saprolegnia parasitica (strain CBS 223.65) TaxID=695850 RepID=A0A067CLG3_SAPPC|nr:TKL protein kinase [Saprolegnia parasitica CBS 223.65]KDO31348.1 TKL protein kinase [Saprolegnia parasitica CBS 223.65]|eukprot:XP_012197947.1 TKL protein kinase [Saprolegnia parasitica CBS 223.65]
MDLLVCVKEARGLRNTQLFGTQDPYCTIKISGHKVKTKVHAKGGVEPRFAATFHIPSVDVNDPFQIEIKNHSMLRKAHIGIYRAPLHEAIAASLGAEHWFKLDHRTKHPSPGGEVCLRLELRASSLASPEPPVNGHFEFPRPHESREYKSSTYKENVAQSAPPQTRFQLQSNNNAGRSPSDRKNVSAPAFIRQERHSVPPELAVKADSLPAKSQQPQHQAPSQPPPYPSATIPRMPPRSTPSRTSSSSNYSSGRDSWARQASGESSTDEPSTVRPPLFTIPNPDGDGRIVYMGSNGPPGSFRGMSPITPDAAMVDFASNQVRPVTTSMDEIDWAGYEELQAYRHLYIYPSMVKIIRSLQSDYMKTELAHYGGTLAMVKSLKFPDEKDALVKEIISLSKVDCPKVLRFMGFYISPTAGLCCVTENLAGNPPDLRALLNRPKPGLTWQDKLRIATEVAEALVYMHAQKPIMIHRNIKAASVILGRRREAVLSGFGCCRDRSYDQTMTSGVGDVQWSAPEMLMDGDYAERVDVYSFGVLLVELDTHEIPFLKESETYSRSDFIGMLVTGRLRHRPSASCPAPIRDIVALCIQHDPGLRPDMRQVLGRLQAVSL